MKPSTRGQIYIRNEKGQVWGPLGIDSISLLVGNGLLHGELQVSKDGTNFALPGQFPDVRDFFPKELWGPTGPPPPRPAAAAPKSSASPSVPPRLRPISASSGAASGPPVTVGPPRLNKVTQPSGNTDTAPPRAPVAGPNMAGESITNAAPGSPDEPELARAPNVANEVFSGPPPSGDFSKTSPARIYYLAASADSTGVLSFKLKDRTIDIHFRKGNPEFVCSSHPDDSEEAFLLGEGLATKDQIERAHTEKPRFGGELIGTLFALGSLNPATAITQLGERLLRLIAKAFIAESGTFTFAPSEQARPRGLPMANRWQTLADAVRRIRGVDLRKCVQPVIERPAIKSGGRVPVSELRLTPQEMRAYGFVDGVRSLTHLMATAPAEQADHYLRMAFLLSAVDNLSFGDVTPKPEAGAERGAAQAKAPPPQSLTPPSSPAAKSSPPHAPPLKTPVPASSTQRQTPSATPMAPVDLEQALRETRKKAEGIKDKNFFQILEVTETSDANAVKAAYFRLAKTYHPDTVPPGGSEELLGLKAQIFAAVNQAYQVLSDPSERENYVETLKSGISGEVDVAQIFAAEELFRRGRAQVTVRKYAEAIGTFDAAIQANAEEGEYYAWRGYAKFLTSNDRKKGQEEAKKDLRIALQKNDRCAQAHYFLGYIARVVGDHAGASKSFQQVLELAPSHVEAQRELRLLSGKK